VIAETDDQRHRPWSRAAAPAPAGCEHGRRSPAWPG
jgi:hypothetical protein